VAALTRAPSRPPNGSAITVGWIHTAIAEQPLRDFHEAAATRQRNADVACSGWVHSGVKQQRIDDWERQIAVAARLSKGLIVPGRSRGVHATIQQQPLDHVPMARATGPAWAYTVMSKLSIRHHKRVPATKSDGVPSYGYRSGKIMQCASNVANVRQSRL